MSFSPTTPDHNENNNKPLSWDEMIDVCRNFNDEECYKSHRQFYIAHTFSWNSYKKSVIELFYSNRNDSKSIDLKSLHRFSRVAVELYKSNKVNSSSARKFENDEIKIVCQFGNNGSVKYAEVLYKGNMLCCFEMFDNYSKLRVYSDYYVFCDHSMEYVSNDVHRGPYVFGLDQYKILRA